GGKPPEASVFIPLPPEKISLSKLPRTGSIFLGREKDIEILDKAWEDSNTCIVTLVAWGGVGKSSLVNEWLNRIAKENFRGAEKVYGWSFYSQGTSMDRQTSADDFIDDALKWFGDPDPARGSPWDKGKRLVELIRKKKTLLILDGMEPLQYPPGEMHGYLKDQAMKAVLKELARLKLGLCIISSRINLEDIEHAVGRSVKRICLGHLPPEVGAELLQQLGVKGSTAELQHVSTVFKGHALALNLLGRYLAVVHDGDIRKRDLIRRLTEEEKEGSHARRVMETYEEFLKGKPELDILYIMGLFDRPVEREAIDSLLTNPPIDGLTTNLKNISDAQWQYALLHLRDLNLLAEKEVIRQGILDCHPLVREHFGEKLRKNNSAAWKEAHSRLFDYYIKLPEKEFPDTLKEMEPLYTAIPHGCFAGKYEEALVGVYKKRILRENKHFSWRNLGSFASDLAALSTFFSHPWDQLENSISEDSKCFILIQIGLYLRALGRLEEALQAIKSALKTALKQKKWKNAAIAANHLSGIYFNLGDISNAIKSARQSVDLIDCTDHVFWRSFCRTTLADRLHQTGKIKEAENWFIEAEALQTKSKSEYLFNIAMQSFRFCDQLLSQGKYKEVQNRTEKMSKLELESNFSKGLNYLSMGRSYWFQSLDENSSDFKKALDYLNYAVEDLKKAGEQDYLARCLLSRAAVFRTMKKFSKAWEDLNDTFEIIERGMMNLLSADYHLEASQLSIDEGKKEEARKYFETAREMINNMKYHRRDGEVSSLFSKLS
ncbi:MAG TPA: tetratricopeptide repeat protein, partial [Candidatus Kapabacteria bacterium]|nr:tetratricopeptide repeat protein [Candidatus Kapabacteria bacterium]